MVYMIVNLYTSYFEPMHMNLIGQKQKKTTRQLAV